MWISHRLPWRMSQEQDQHHTWRWIRTELSLSGIQTLLQPCLALYGPYGRSDPPGQITPVGQKICQKTPVREINRQAARIWKIRNISRTGWICVSLRYYWVKYYNDEKCCGNFIDVYTYKLTGFYPEKKSFLMSSDKNCILVIPIPCSPEITPPKFSASSIIRSTTLSASCIMA